VKVRQLLQIWLMVCEHFMFGSVSSSS